MIPRPGEGHWASAPSTAVVSDITAAGARPVLDIFQARSGLGLHHRQDGRSEYSPSSPATWPPVAYYNKARSWPRTDSRSRIPRRP